MEKIAETLARTIVDNKISLRKFAAAIDVSYVKVLNASRMPVKGVAYDPEATNWDALVEVLKGAKKLEAFTEKDWAQFAIEGNLAQGVKVEKDYTKFQVGMKVWIRRSEKPFEIVWTTDSHIVIIEEGSTEPRSWGWETFLANGPAFEARKK